MKEWRITCPIANMYYRIYRTRQFIRYSIYSLWQTAYFARLGSGTYAPFAWILLSISNYDASFGEVTFWWITLMGFLPLPKLFGCTPSSINFVNACLSLWLTRNHRGTQSINRHRRKITPCLSSGWWLIVRSRASKESQARFCALLTTEFLYRVVQSFSARRNAECWVVNAYHVVNRLVAIGYSSRFIQTQ